MTGDRSPAAGGNDLMLGGKPVDLDHVATLMMHMARDGQWPAAGSASNSAVRGVGADPSLLSLDLAPLQKALIDLPSHEPSLRRPVGPSGPLGQDPGYYFLRPTVAGRRASAIRDDFPILGQRVNGHRLVWLDSAATTQKPASVIDAEAAFYRRDNSNVHRGAHALARRSTEAYESARRTVQRFLGAAAPEEIVFVRGATEGLNAVANTLGEQRVGEGDEILVSHLEHHSNIVPWQLLCQRKKARLRVIPVDDRGELRMDAYADMLGPRTRVVALAQVSNALGTLVAIEPMAALAHRHGACVVVDGAQSVAHLPVDVRALGADFFVFSGHKLYAPTGIGVLYGRRELLEAMPPWQGGGSMIRDVTFEHTSYAPPPARFEAGTGHFAGAVGLAAAIDYLEAQGRPAVAAHEQALMAYAVDALARVPGLRLLGAPVTRIGALPFVMEGFEAGEVARALDARGIAVRAGHHCAQPILRRFGLEESVRASLGIYSEQDDIDALVAALGELPHRHSRHGL